MLKRFSLGTGDRFGQQGKAQLRAVQKAKRKHGTVITPVWNKSHREHQIIGTGPKDVREEADTAIEELGWKEEYCVDADHITKKIVDPYIPYSNFFTIDVAEYIGKKPESSKRKAFLLRNSDWIGTIEIPGIDERFRVTESFLKNWADQYLLAIREANEIYKYIHQRKLGQAVFEISMDEVEAPQTPIELFFILKTVAEEDIAINTIAPKFTGDFYKGVDYVGDSAQFVKEFERDILVISYAVEQFRLPPDLKLSIHSGSDKFSLYPYINRLLKKYNVGVHLKTSGTTWLEELIGLAISGFRGLEIVKQIYEEAYNRYEELTKPYKPVINIKRDRLPSPEKFSEWNKDTLASKLEHNPKNLDFDPQLRQFLHCSYKIAAEKGDDFICLLQQNEDLIGERVTYNLFARHINPLFLGRSTD